MVLEAHNFIMRGKRVSNRRPTDPGPFQPYEEGYECLMGKPKNCRCHLCVRVDRIEAYLLVNEASLRQNTPNH